MATSSDADPIKQHQLELVTTLQNTHDELRRKFQEIEKKFDPDYSPTEWENVWRNHTKSQESLKKYSKAMYELATEIWEPRYTDTGTSTSCRFEWIKSKCEIHFGTKMEIETLKFKTLDVGSCYNPLTQKFPNFFDVTAIDLCPAPGYQDTVYICDFLGVQLSEETEVKIDPNDNTRILSLPINTFDIVVFSFFIDYLPDRKQRVESCRRALQLLREGGLLFIMRPDFKSATETNVRQIKQMKVGLGIIGFRRIFCEKLKFLWCTGYVKLGVDEAAEYLTSWKLKNDSRKINFNLVSNWDTEIHLLFNIPQDFRNWNEKDQSVAVPEGASTILFDELPQFGSESESD